MQYIGMRRIISKHDDDELMFQFNKLSHNCAGVSVLGVLGEEDVFMEDYQDYKDLLLTWSNVKIVGPGA